MSEGAPTYDLGNLHGGLRLPGEKEASSEHELIVADVPKQLILPICQHVGDPAQPVVRVGDRVLKGQLVADSDSSLSAPVHASSSGEVIAIEPWPVSRRNGDPAPCIVIECDGRDEPLDTHGRLTDYRELDPSTLLEKILEGGVVGLGGAVFPTAQKLMQAVSTPPIEYLILNGVECEPFISCDDALMREFAAEVLHGAQILLQVLGVSTCYVAVESDKQQAIAKLVEALQAMDDERITLKQVPTIYPSGAEDQLVQLVTGLEVPSGGLPTDVGCVVQNVGTAAAIQRWIVAGEPLISRITTVTGDGVTSPLNVVARIGTPVSELVALAGGYTERANHMVIGGPMTGKSVTTDEIPVVKATNCVLVLSDPVSTGTEKPCIRCGECATVCPIQLLPQQLHWFACADNEEKLREYGLTDCIECGCCDLVCPSHIPLTSDFRQAKAWIRELADEKARAERARQRFEARNQRLASEAEERERELSEQKADAKKAGPEAIEAILKRKQQKDDEDA